MKAMKNAVLDFWNYITENWDLEVVEEYAESYEIDASKMTAEQVSRLSEKEAENLLGSLASLYMDVSGNENYGDVYALIIDITKIDEKKVARILELDEDK